eukprot:5046041-Amphidinium_carterae.3
MTEEPYDRLDPIDVSNDSNRILVPYVQSSSLIGWTQRNETRDLAALLCLQHCMLALLFKSAVSLSCSLVTRANPKEPCQA